MDEMHKEGYIHRDLKPDNIILTKDCLTKIIDYGFTCHVPKDGKVKGKVGTKSYMAPEISTN